jgi:hypothetical protein
VIVENDHMVAHISTSFVLNKSDFNATIL